MWRVGVCLVYCSVDWLGETVQIEALQLVVALLSS